MHTIPVLKGADRLLYHEYLQSDHDFEMWADVLTLEETLTDAGSEVDVLDGQVNFARSGDDPDRTCSLTLSDPEHALTFGTSSARDGADVLWVNRLVRVRHRVTVPTLGTVTATPFIGLPTSVTRNGGEVGLEMGDKSLLADHGVRPRTYKKGANVAWVLRSILGDLTGERHFRIPSTRKRLSEPYTVGMGDDALTPWRAARKIARKEANWFLFYSSDGFATAEPMNSKKDPVEVHHVLALPDSSTSFTDFSNYVKVTSVRKPSNREREADHQDHPHARPIVEITREGVAVLPRSNDLSEQSLSRNGVPRTLPLVISDNDLKTQRDVNRRAKDELQEASGLEAEETYEIMPFFHLDTRDVLFLPRGIGRVTFDQVSIPLGTGGNMVLGATKWVSRPVRVKRVRATTTVRRKKKKGGKKHD